MQLVLPLISHMQIAGFSQEVAHIVYVSESYHKKAFFWATDLLPQKTACAAIEDGTRIEIRDLEDSLTR